MDKKNVKGFLEFVYDFYKSMKAHEITLVYEGEITHQITKAFTSLTESNMAKEEESNTVQKKVFHVMVECLQNISKHADSFGSDDFLFAGRGIFMVSKGDIEYHVTTGNVIENSKIEELTKILDHINTLDKDGLKELYKTQMREGRLSEKGGAGLGFIDIARKTGRKLEYHFLPIDEETHFFYPNFNNIQKRVNRRTMETIKIMGTDDTPTVILDSDSDIFEISGRSLPEDVTAFYEPILNWLDDYANSPNAKTIFTFKLVYFNTASSKLLLDILMKLEQMHEDGKEVLIRWFYPEDDEDMQEAGEEYADIVDIPFEQVSYTLS